MTQIPTLKSLLDAHEARCAACRRGGNGGIFDELAAPHTCPERDETNGVRGSEDEDPEPVTLTYMPRTGRSGAAAGWLLLGLAVGIMAGWTCFL